jgi:hypothetical protein
MATPHIPNINNIKSLANEEIRFYALAGAIMSLGAGLELAYFDLFERATKINRDIAASFFYLVLNASTRRDMADAAVSGVLKDSLLAEWKTLYKRVETLTGRNSQRNLLGHAVIRQDITPFGVTKHFLGAAISYHVEEDAALLLAGHYKARSADFHSLFAYCEEIIAVLNDLDAFLGKLP